MKLFLFFFIFSFCFSADYIKVTKSYELKEKPGTFIGPGYLYSEEEFKKLLLEISNLQSEKDILAAKLKAEMEIKQINQEKEEALQKINSEKDKLHRDLKEIFEKRVFLYKETSDLYKENFEQQKKINRNTTFENRLLKIGLFVLPWIK